MLRRHEDLFEVFDSLGITVEDVRRYFQNQFHGVFEFNESPIQSLDSSACGEFCIFYVIQRYFNEDLLMEEILEEWFSKDLNKNESIVKTFLENL